MRFAALRERGEVYLGTYSLSSRSGLQPEVVFLYVSEFVATYAVTVHQEIANDHEFRPAVISSGISAS